MKWHLCIYNTKWRMHHSIIIQGKPSQGEFIFTNPYRFHNPYITIMKVLLKSINDSIFNIIDQTNIVSNDKGESVTFEKGFYSLSQIIDILNTMMYSQFSLSNDVDRFGCIHISSSIDFSITPDICDRIDIKQQTYSKESIMEMMWLILLEINNSFKYSLQ